MATLSEAPAVPWRRLAASRWAFAFGAAAAAAFGASADDTMRCRNGRLINVGMLAEDVSSRCGEPKSRTVEEIPVNARLPTGAVRQTGTTQAERWIYSRGQGLSDALLTFEDGKLLRIELLTER
jgi:Protein of unknown function (DUF2845)